MLIAEIFGAMLLVTMGAIALWVLIMFIGLSNLIFNTVYGLVMRQHERRKRWKAYVEEERKCY